MHDSPTWKRRDHAGPGADPDQKIVEKVRGIGRLQEDFREEAEHDQPADQEGGPRR